MMELMRILSPCLFAVSTAIHLVKQSTPAFPMLYPSTFVMTCFALTDEMLTMLPPFCLAMAAPMIFVGMMVPMRLRSSTCLKPSMFMSNTSWSGWITPWGMLPPAPLTSPSMLPNCSRVMSRTFSMSFSSSTFPLMKRALPPLALISEARLFPSSSFLPTITAVPPKETIPSMKAFPRIPVPPVTTITLSCNENNVE